jgi:hypothetical protein
MNKLRDELYRFFLNRNFEELAAIKATEKTLSLITEHNKQEAKQRYDLAMVGVNVILDHNSRQVAKTLVEIASGYKEEE